MVKVTKWYAAWCGPCQVIAPEMDRMHAAGDINLTSINIEDDWAAARAAGIRGVPTIIVHDDEGNELHRYAGLAPLKQYLEGEKHGE